MARTTFDLDSAVLRELRRRGRAEGESMNQVASEALARAFVAEATDTVLAFEWRVADLGKPLVDLEDQEAVRLALDASA